MTLTDRTMGWLNQNRRRAYPMDSEEWRAVASPESGLDCIILDASVFDGDAHGAEDLYAESVEVSDESTTVYMRYGDVPFSVVLDGGDVSGPGSYESVSMSLYREGARPASMSLSFSSHAYIRDVLGAGSWRLGCRALRSRAAGLSDGHGVDGLRVNGSARVEGHADPMVLEGDVELEDGYRTSPVVYGGRVVVRVGRRYGLDPCGYDFGDEADMDCRRSLFFFCGQNAVNSGNIALRGGPGVGVSQGRSYLVRSGSCEGMTIPCVEIVAGEELLGLYRP